MPHLVVIPIVLPLCVAALLLLVPETRRSLKGVASVAACLANLGVALALLQWSTSHVGTATVAVYLPSNWPAPFGIALAADRLAALMLALTAVVAVAASTFATGRWQHVGVHFHSLLQLQLMGVNGAFLTADLFNLFVFFEVMLAASYGLLLHGSGRARVGAGLKYIAINLLASSLFLIGVAVIYGIAGTLSYPDIARRLADVAAADRGLLHAGAAILGIALLAKAAMWPVNFWLVPAYGSAGAPVAAMFVILTKVGVYAVLRLWSLFAAGESSPAWFGADALIVGGLATLAFGAIGLLSARTLRRAASFGIVLSSGTLIAAIGIGGEALVGAALYYLVGSTLAAAMLFLIAELVDRARESEVTEAYDVEADHLPFYLAAQPGGRLHPGEGVVPIGEAIPAALAFLGTAFIAAALLVAGLPPLSGFLAKFAMLSALLEGGRGPLVSSLQLSPSRTALFVLTIAAGLAAMIAFSRAGIRYFWAPQGRAAPRLRVVECLPIAALMLACAALVVGAGAVLDFTRQAAAGATGPGLYSQSVLETPARPRRQP